MTETEAKTKWCPMFVASHTNPREMDIVVNLGDQSRPATTTQTFAHNCIGSQCAVWQNDGTIVDKAEQPIETGHCGLMQR